jgi:AraC-like DNA-binding protein
MTVQSQRGLREIVFSDKEQAEAYLSQIAGCITDVDFAEGGFYMSYTGGSLGGCALHRGSTSALRYQVVPSAELHFVVMQSGATRFVDPRRSAEAAPRRKALLLGPSSEGRSEVEEDSNGISMIVDAEAMRGYADRLVGDKAKLRLDAIGPVSLDLGEPVAGTLARNLTGAFHELQALGRSGLSTLALRHFDELLLGLACVAVSPDLRELLRDRSPDVGSQVVRRARDFIHTHAAEPISFSELAGRLGVGLRSLQIAFRREVGCSPRDYLMACRLEVARACLLAGGDGATVTQIALECGFTDMAVFARRYRENFGEKPSETLRRR